MKIRKLIPVFFAVLFMVVFATSTTKAQDRRFVDITGTKRYVDPFVKVMSESHVQVWTTFKEGTNYRKDWEQPTYMMLTGTCFPWTDQQGMAHLHCFVHNPPILLENYRPPQTVNTAPFDMDGNIVTGDPGYWIRHRIWQTRPVVDFVQNLKNNKSMASAWNYWAEHNKGIERIGDQWEALGLDRDGTVPGVYASVNPETFGNHVGENISQTNQEWLVRQVNWKYDGVEIQPEQTEYSYLNEESADNGSMSSVIGLVGASLIILVIGLFAVVKSRNREKVYV